MPAYFLAGTDTGVGKTYVTCVLLSAVANAGKGSLGLKPIAAGAEQNENGQWQNEDALELLAASSINRPYERVNPVCLPEAMSPHLAAQCANETINFERLVAQVDSELSEPVDLCIVEGAGGWRVPLALGAANKGMSDLALALNLPVILVVGMRLGCLNHAVLSAEAIERDGLQIKGWVANEIDPSFQALEQNIESLQHLLAAPMLARIPHSEAQSREQVLTSIDISNFL